MQSPSAEIPVRLFREPVSGISHAVGALLAVVGLILLVLLAVAEQKQVHVAAFSVFGASMIMLYSSSALYHLLRASEKTVTLLRRIDHVMIYILIAGTYTPVCLVGLRGTWGTTLFILVWMVAIVGICFSLLWINAPRWLATSLYLLMGWIAVAAIVPLVRAISVEGIVWLFLGGAFYTLGAIIYAMKWPNPFPRTFGFHEIWHLFVLAGTFSHFMMMLHAILPMPQ
ncbi:MAG: hemolysin III family protein [Ignavibacteriae bacterium]|nr:hemolysin III family protein [Ignavibacteriota bacterium]